MKFEPSQPGYVVINFSEGMPTVLHPTAEAAKKEATRMARACRGQQFHVLKWVGTAEISDITWTVPPDIDDLPF